jgi:hypothetical protein
MNAPQVLTDQQRQTTPLGLLRYAIEYYAAADAADDSIGDDHRYDIHAPMVVNFLVGQAIETVRTRIANCILQSGDEGRLPRLRPAANSRCRNTPAPDD